MKLPPGSTVQPIVTTTNTGITYDGLPLFTSNTISTNTIYLTNAVSTMPTYDQMTKQEWVHFMVDFEKYPEAIEAMKIITSKLYKVTK